MDNGYRILRHTVAQVFGNFPQAVQLTLLLTVLPGLYGHIFLGDFYAGMAGLGSDPDVMPEVPSDALLHMLILVLLSVVTYCWAAVGWHRFILREEHGAGPVPHWRGPEILSYIGRAITLGLVLLAVALVAGIALGIVLVALPNQMIASILMVGLLVGMTWLLTRLGLILPAAALGEKMTLGESWQATKPVSSDILVPLLVIGLSATILGQMNLSFFGGSIIAVAISILIYWLQTLLSLSLMTTIYGTQVEGRSLN